GGPITPRAWGVTTQRGDSVFVHVLDWPDRALAIPAFGRRVIGAAMLAGGASIAFEESHGAIILTLPPGDTTAPDRVVVLITGASTGGLIQR
ncbi:MAG TPA: hypothetical protein VIJ16_03510, partial [Gemmatimonadaceae bacterium]